MHCPGIAVLTDHPRRPLFYYCKSDLFIHTSLPVPPPPPPARFAALFFILNHLLVSTWTSSFLLIFLFLILRGPGGRGHREHKCIYCPQFRNAPSASTTTSILFFSGRDLLICLTLLDSCLRGSIIFYFSLLYFLLFCHAYYYGLSLGPCSSFSSTSFSPDFQNQPWLSILGIDPQILLIVLLITFSSFIRTDVFAFLRYVMVDQSSIILFILRSTLLFMSMHVMSSVYSMSLCWFFCLPFFSMISLSILNTRGDGFPTRSLGAATELFPLKLTLW